jgi:nicotinamide-nucleotide amidase
VDDVTRQAVARATGRPLVLDEQLLAHIEALFARRGYRFTDNNRRQAQIPQGATPIENPVGTASAFIVEEQGRLVISLPGVPRELKHLTEQRVIPFLREQFGLRGVIKSRVLHVTGLPESRVDHLIADLEQEQNPTVGLLAHPGQIDVRIAAKAEDEAQADALIRAMEARLGERLGEAVYGVDEETLEGVVTDLLARRGLTLAVLETNTGGLVCQRLTRTPQGRTVLRAGFVATTTEALTATAGVPLADWSAALPQTADEAARNVRQMTGADLGLALLGDPDPAINPYSPTPGLTLIALATREETVHRELKFGGASELVQGWATNSALDLLRR